MALFDNEHNGVDQRPLDPDELEYERNKAANKAVVIGSLVASFFVGFAVAKIDSRSILDPSVQRFSAAIGGVVANLLFAGIPSVIAAKFTTKWRYFWLAITILLLTSQVVVYFYEAKILN